MPHTRRPTRPACEPLEGRALMATSILDPSFGAGGGVVGQDSALNNGTAVAVQPDGKVVVAGYGGAYQGFGNQATFVPSGLAVRRFNADGTPDASFGAGGVAAIPLPASATGFLDGPRGIALRPDGSIVLAAPLSASAATAPAGASTFNEGLVVQLTPTGQLDPAFGTGGKFVLPQSAGTAESVAIDGQGRVVVAGLRNQLPDNPGGGLQQGLVARLTPTGALDPTFHETGVQTISYVGINGFAAGLDVAVAPGGQYYVTSSAPSGPFGGSRSGTLTRINADGTLDATYGTSGSVAVAPGRNLTLAGLAVQADGKVVLVGTATVPFQGTGGSGAFLARLLPDGSVDPAFAGFTGNYDSSSVHAQESLTSVAVAQDGSIVASGTGPFGVSLVDRLRADGTGDPSFGRNGRYTIVVPNQSTQFAAVAFDPAGRVVLAGTVENDANVGKARHLAVVRLLDEPSKFAAGDYDGDGRSDVAAVLANVGYFAYRKATGGDLYYPFGPTGIGVGAMLPAPGDYDGDGIADPAAYFPATGTLRVKYSSTEGNSEEAVTFGPAGAGQAIPAPGDYDGDGLTDVAVYLPTYGALAVRPSAGGPNYLVTFGPAGAGQSVPAPGDYDGDGRSDVAVYLPQFGALAVKPSGGGLNQLIPFGSAGGQASIPAPGDYDGDGLTDVAVYLPAAAAFAVRPSAGGANYLIPFGQPGVGLTIPAPGDYDGDGKADAAAYLPALGLYAYRGSAGGGDGVQGFGAPGEGLTVPAASIPYAQPPTVAASSLGAGRAAADLIPLTDDLLAEIAGRKKSAGRA